MPALFTENGPHSGQRHELGATNPTIIGRHPECHIVVDVGAVSRHHAQILEVGGQFFVEDLNSRNGTSVNGEPVRGRHRLSLGDRIQVCDIIFRFGSPATPAPLGSPDNVHASSVFIEDVPTDSSRVMSRLDVVGSGSKSGSLSISSTAEAKLKALIDISRALSRSVRVDSVLPTVLDSLFQLFIQADRGFVILRNEDGVLIPRHTKLRRGDDDRMIRLSKTIINEVVETKQAVLSTDAMDDQRFQLSESIADFRIRSFVCAPLLDAEQNVLGAIQLDSLDHRNRFRPEDLDLLVSVAGQAGIAIDNAQLHEEVVQMRVLERDLELASEVQKSFLPQRSPKLDRYQIDHFYQPAEKVGGDYYDYVALPDGRVAVVLADVVGHGMAAALQTAQLSAALKFSLATNEDPAEAVTSLNRTLSEGSLEDRLITFCMLVLNPGDGHITVVNAGHMPPLLCRKDEPPVELGADLPSSPALLIAEDYPYRSFEFTLVDGDRVLLYTDGLNESMNAAGDLYGKERLIEQAGPEQSAQETTIRLVNDVRKFAAGYPQKDDMCLVCCRRGPVEMSGTAPAG